MEIYDDELLALKKDGDYKYKWILRFYESDFDSYEDLGGSYDFSRYEYTSVSSVVLLRMYFKSNGKLYNLSVVDDIQTGSENPSGGTGSPVTEETDEGKEFLEKLLFCIQLLLGVVLIAVIFYIIHPILPAVGKVFAWIVTAPIKLVGLMKDGIKYIEFGLDVMKVSNERKVSEKQASDEKKTSEKKSKGKKR